MAKNKGSRILITLECTECRTNINKRSAGVSRYLTQKIAEITQNECNLKNIVRIVTNLLIIKKLNKIMLPQKQKSSPLGINEKVRYKNIPLLISFMTEQGKILPRRATGVTVQQQRQIAKSIKRARILGLLPFVASHEV